MSLRTGLLQQRDRGERAAARGEHGIDDQRGRVGEVRRQPGVVARRERRVLVALQADVTDTCVRQQFEDGFDHAEARAQHGHDDDIGVEHFALGLLERRFDARQRHGKFARGFRSRRPGSADG